MALCCPFSDRVLGAWIGFSSFGSPDGGARVLCCLAMGRIVFHSAYVGHPEPLKLCGLTFLRSRPETFATALWFMMEAERNMESNTWRVGMNNLVVGTFLYEFGQQMMHSLYRWAVEVHNLERISGEEHEGWWQLPWPSWFDHHSWKTRKTSRPKLYILEKHLLKIILFNKVNTDYILLSNLTQSNSIIPSFYYMIWHLDRIFSMP